MTDSTKVLLIESEAIVRLDVAQLLESQGYQVFEATTAQRGLELAEKEQPAVIFCGTNLPDMDEFDLVAHIRKKVNSAQPHFIFLTMCLFLSMASGFSC